MLALPHGKKSALNSHVPEDLAVPTVEKQYDLEREEENDLWTTEEICGSRSRVHPTDNDALK
jgi:hypothetical protein